MTDEQRKHLVQMLSPINEQAAKNKVEADFEAVKKRLRTFIELRRIHPEDLPQYTVQKVVEDYNGMTIITDTCHYLQVSAEHGYGGNVDFCTCDNPGIEDAYKLGILSEEQHAEYEEAQQAHLGRRREIDARNRLTNFVREAGANNVQEYLDELNQQEEQSMNDEQRDPLAKTLDSATLSDSVGRLKAEYQKLKNEITSFIRSRRIDPEDLPSYKTRDVFVEDTSLTIVTDDRHFVRVSSERDYDESVQFSTVECPDIEDALTMGILSQEQYDEYKQTERSYIGRRDAGLLKARIEDLVRIAGEDNVQEYLNGIRNQ